MLTQMTWHKQSLVLGFMSFVLWEIYTEFENGGINYKMWFLNVFLPKFRKLISNLLHLMILDRKRKFLKELCFVLKNGKLKKFLLLYNECFTGIKLKRYWGLWFLNVVKQTKLSALMS